LIYLTENSRTIVELIGTPKKQLPLIS